MKKFFSLKMLSQTFIKKMSFKLSVLDGARIKNLFSLKMLDRAGIRGSFY